MSSIFGWLLWPISFMIIFATLGRLWIKNAAIKLALSFILMPFLVFILVINMPFAFNLGDMYAVPYIGIFFIPIGILIGIITIVYIFLPEKRQED